MSIRLVMPSYHLILCHPLLLLPSIFPNIRVFYNELAVCIRWPQYWSFSFSSSPSNEHSGLISFRIDWFELLAVQETLKSLLQHHSSKPSILLHSAFFTVQSHIHTWLLEELGWLCSHTCWLLAGAKGVTGQHVSCPPAPCMINTLACYRGALKKWELPSHLPKG